MQSLRFNPHKHHIVNLPLSHWLKREFPTHDLFIYRHEQTKNFIIAEWIHQDSGVCIEHICMSEPNSFDTTLADNLRRFLRKPISNKDLSRDIGGADRDFNRAMDDEQQDWRGRNLSPRKTQVVMENEYGLDRVPN